MSWNLPPGCTDKDIDDAAPQNEPRPSGPIIVQHVYPPIPDRQFDYCAFRDGYEPGLIVGWGKTQEEAIADLLELEEDAAETEAA